jgi:prepilin-type N-terminal cleavage/methylation domain-containing protein
MGRISKKNRRRFSRTPGFTLVEMMIVVGAIALLAVLVLEVCGAACDAANRAGCASHLRAVWQACAVYADGNRGYFPYTGATTPLAGVIAPGSFYFNDTWDNRGTPFWPVQRNTGNAGNLYLLIRLHLATVDEFVCPASGDVAAFEPFNGGRFSFLAFQPGSIALTAQEQEFLQLHATRHCSYSYQNVLGMFNGVGPVAPGSGALQMQGPPAGLAILADHNPYTQLQGEARTCLDPTAAPLANSLNHAGAGQNVLYLNGSVQWCDTPECGAALGNGTHDNIYLPAGGSVIDPTNVPHNNKDSYLVP